MASDTAPTRPRSAEDDEDKESGTSTPIANAPSSEEGDEENEDLPLTLAASVVLSDLPHDASAALAATVATTGPADDKKVVVKFKAVGAAAQLSQDVCKISATRKFEEVVRYLRRKLKCKDTDSVFLYVNSAFAPSLDEVVGNLHQVGSFCIYSGLETGVRWKLTFSVLQKRK